MLVGKPFFGGIPLKKGFNAHACGKEDVEPACGGAARSARLEITGDFLRKRSANACSLTAERCFADGCSGI